MTLKVLRHWWYSGKLVVTLLGVAAVAGSHGVCVLSSQLPPVSRVSLSEIERPPFPPVSLFWMLLPSLLLLPLRPPDAQSQLLLLQYAASTTAGGTSGSDGTASTAAVARGERQATRSTLLSPSSSSASPPSAPPQEQSPEGLFQIGSKLNGSANGYADGVGGREGGGSGGNGGVSSLLLVPPRESPGGGGTTVGWVGSGGRGGWGGGGRQGTTLGEKVVARALECLERLCGSEECERFMTPLAREVSFTFYWDICPLGKLRGRLDGGTALRSGERVCWTCS